MKGAFGTEFTAGNVLQIFLVLIGVFLVAGFIISASGGIQGMLQKLCDAVPQLCGGGYSSAEYEIAKQSAKMLACGINNVFSGQESCTETISINTPLTGAATSAPIIAKENEASLYCNFKEGYPELDYEEGCGRLNPLCRHSNVQYLFESGEWKWKSKALKENDYKPISKMGSILDKVDHVHEREIYPKLIKIKSGSDEEKLKQGLEVLKDAILSDDYGRDDKIIIVHNNGQKEVLDRNTIGYITQLERERTATCKVTNFNIPENFAGGIFDKAKQYINAFGDPSFLLYYQYFPYGEDADWRSKSEWFTSVGKGIFIVMCVMDAINVLKVAKSALWSGGKKIIEKGVDKLTKLKPLKGLEGETKAITEAERLAPELVGKVQGAEILARMKKANINKGIVDYFKEKYPGNAEEAFRKATEPLRAAGKKIDDYNALRNGFVDVWNGKHTNVDLSRILLDKAEPGLMERFMKKTIQKAGSRETLVRAAKYVGIDYGIAYYAARFDTELGKFIKQYPNSLVLGMPLVREEPEPLVINTIPKDSKIYDPFIQNLIPIGRPVILIKKEWGNQPTPFYLASPCRANLTIEAKPMKCGLYTYDGTSGLTTCDNPDKKTSDTWWKKIWGNDDQLPECGSLIAGEHYVYDKFKNVAVNTIENIGSSEVYGGEVTLTTPSGDISRIKITDPIDGINFYYDKENKVIDWIGATFWTGPNEDDYEYQVRPVSYFMQAAENDDKYGKVCYPLNNKDDGRSMCFDKRWTNEGSWPAENRWGASPPVVVTTNTGTQGFACREHEIGKYPLASYSDGTIKYVDKQERFVMGEGGIDTEKKYFSCEGPKIWEPKSDGYFNIYFNNSDDSEFYALRIGKDRRNEYSRYDFVFKDTNYDGRIDEFGEYVLDISPADPDASDTYEESLEHPEMYYQCRIFMDKDFDGTTESVISTNCQVPGAVTIEPDKIGKDKFGNNYCYQKESGTWNVISTVLMLGASAFSKTGSGALLSMAVDCGIVAAEFAGVGHSNWPGG